MATPRAIRRLAFQALFQLDALEGETEPVREWLEAEAERESPKLRPAELERIWAWAEDAWKNRRDADQTIRGLAPGWPAMRQPSVDRALLRLAHNELAQGKTDPRIIISEAVELAKQFSTDRSPAFVNGVLAKMVRGDADAPPVPEHSLDDSNES